MPVKQDSQGNRYVEMEVVVPGTPEQVWQAMATGPGNSAWFTKTTIDEHVGGKLQFEFGPDGASVGEVTAWEPPQRFSYVEREWMPGAPPVATDISIAPRSDDKCVLRMVHTIVTDKADWDDQLESFEGGWPGFFEVLKVYLAHFAGQPAASIRVGAACAAGDAAAWKRMTSALALTGSDIGDAWQTPSELPKLSGVIERVQQHGSSREVMVRLEQPQCGIMLVATFTYGGTTRGILSFYFYGPMATASAEAAQRAWSPWINQLLGS